jgi:arabinofuranosyltransferase
LLQGVLFALPLVILAVQGWRHRYIIDDGFIYLRIVDNITSGNGPVYNVGDRVEVYTGVLWTFLLALAGWLTPVALEWVAVVLGLGLTLLGVGLGMWGSKKLLADGSSWLLPVAALMLASLHPMWNFATTGLETGLTFAWLGAAWLSLVLWAVREPNSRIPAWTLVLLGLGPLVRPELVVSSAAFLVLLFLASWRGESWRGRARIALWGLALPVFYQVFRMGYFGELVANTAIAKEGTKPRPEWGVKYLLDFVEPYALWLPVLLIVFGVYAPAMLTFAARAMPDGRRRALVLGVFVGAGAVNGALVVLMGGDYLHARLLLPALFAIVIPAAVVPIERRYALGLLTVVWSVFALFVARPPATIFPFDTVSGNGTVTAEQFGFYDGSPNTAWLGEGLYMRSTFAYPTRELAAEPAEGVRLPTLVQGAMGLEGFFFGPDLTLFDLNGLATPLASHMELTRRGHPGHEKSLPTPWVAAAVTADGTPAEVFDEIQAERAAASAFYGPLIPVTTGEELDQEIAWARAALKCEPLADFVAATRRPLSAHTAWSNVTGAFERTRMRIPADPQAAYEKFCT